MIDEKNEDPGPAILRCNVGKMNKVSTAKSNQVREAMRMSMSGLDVVCFLIDSVLR